MFHENAIQDFVTYLRSDPRYRRCLIYTQIECKYPTQSEQIGACLSACADAKPLVHFIRKSERAKPISESVIGVNTGEPGFTKIDMANNARTLFQSGTLKIDENVRGPQPKADIAELCTQLKNLQNIVDEPATPHGKPRETVSGKPKGPDDAATVLLINVTATTAILHDRDLVNQIEMSGRRLFAK